MLAFAWLTIAVVSDAPLISWDVWKKREAPRWLGVGQSLAAAALLGVTQVFASLHPARGFLFAMTAFALGELCVVTIERTKRWAQWARGVPQQRRLLIHAFVRPSVTNAIRAVLSCRRAQRFTE